MINCLFTGFFAGLLCALTFLALTSVISKSVTNPNTGITHKILVVLIWKSEKVGEKAMVYLMHSLAQRGSSQELATHTCPTKDTVYHNFNFLIYLFLILR